MALKRDADLFPSGSEMFPEFLTSAVLRPNLVARNAAYKNALETGYMTANEVRELENLPPMKNADELQQTPVGGAPNPPGGQNPPGVTTNGQ
jgi:phage portal protein BeeE